MAGVLVLAAAAGCAPADGAQSSTVSIVDTSSPVASTTSVEATVTTTTTTATTVPPPVRPSIRAAVDAAEAAMPSGMTLGVAVLDVTTGELVESRSGSRQLYAASLSKLIVVVDMLDRRAQGMAITESDLKLAGRALSASDDGAMNVLWGKHDGPGAITRLATRLGLTGTRRPPDPEDWGETLVTAGDVARIYQHILRDMAPEDRTVITGALAAAAPVATDGFDQHFGLLAQGASPTVYAKQGWVSYLPARLFLHSAGVVHDNRLSSDFAIALLSIQPSGNKQAARERLSKVATLTVAALGS